MSRTAPGKVVTTIVLKAGGEKTITGLAVGTYTVTEDTNWSWSYSIVGDNSKTATLSGTTPSATVDVTNHYNSHNWAHEHFRRDQHLDQRQCRAEKLNRRDDI